MFRCQIIWYKWYVSSTSKENGCKINILIINYSLCIIKYSLFESNSDNK